MSIKHIVIAPDSFKESMSAKQASIAIKEGFERVLIILFIMNSFLWQTVAKEQQQR